MSLFPDPKLPGFAGELTKCILWFIESLCPVLEGSLSQRQET